MKLRFRFEFHHRGDVVGGWDDFTEGMAAAVNKQGLAYACVEALQCDGSPKIIFRLKGDDYVSTQWVGVTTVAGEGTPTPRIVGMAMITRHEIFTAYNDGLTARRMLLPNERNFKQAEHTAGGLR